MSMQVHTQGQHSDAASAQRLRRAASRAHRTVSTRAAILALAIVVPTVGAQGQWADGLRTGFGLTEQPRPAEPMPFETPGESFPGSAFYYLEDTPLLATGMGDAGETSGALEPAEFASESGLGAAARAFRQTGGGLDKARALQCLSMAVYYEAASESYAGQQAVAQVVLNRVAHPAYPASVCGVVFQGSQRQTGCQFTFTCDGSLRREPSRAGWARAQTIALSAMAGEVYRPVGLATHYHTDYVNPYWADSLDYIRSIGAHRFYRWKGKAGQAAAFSMAYSGREPNAAVSATQSLAERRETAPAFASASNPASVARIASVSTNDAAAETTAGQSAMQTPDTAARLPQSGQVRAEYVNSGRWIRDPRKVD